MTVIIAAYKAGVLGRGVPRVAIEAGVTDFWYKYVGLEGAVVGIDTFGESAPAPASIRSRCARRRRRGSRSRTIFPSVSTRVSADSSASVSRFTRISERTLPRWQGVSR